MKQKDDKIKNLETEVSKLKERENELLKMIEKLKSKEWNKDWCFLDVWLLKLNWHVYF